MKCCSSSMRSRTGGKNETDKSMGQYAFAGEKGSEVVFLGKETVELEKSDYSAGRHYICSTDIPDKVDRVCTSYYIWN